jgi:tetraacyldisaccharide 4'-kinase
MLAYLYSLAKDKKNDFLSNLIKKLLYLLSLLYELIIRLIRNFKIKRAYRFSCKLISVGNIVLGGTGKTPLVEYLANFLKREGKKIAILSRGYAQGQNLNDEPKMLKDNLKDIPIIVDKDRLRAIQRAIRDYKVDTVILDDGFQQWQIKKDLEIVTIDVTNPFGNGKLIPRGILREPLDGLKRAQIIVLTKTNLNPDTLDLKVFLEGINPYFFIFEAEYLPLGFYRLNQRELISFSFFKDKKVILFSGIAEPDSFEELILNMDIAVKEHIVFPDHHFYRKIDIEKIKAEGKRNNTNIFITTQKDAVRLKDFALSDMEIYVLKITLKINEEENFFKRILSIYNS